MSGNSKCNIVLVFNLEDGVYLWSAHCCATVDFEVMLAM